jgi:hypothetical protein
MRRVDHLRVRGSFEHIGYVAGRLYQLWRGDYTKRHYAGRHQGLIDCNFNPYSHLDQHGAMDTRKDRETQDVIAAWISGYFNAAKNQGMVNLSRFERPRKAVEKYCRSHKPETPMSSAQRDAC